jgi:hypothetical protein
MFDKLSAQKSTNLSALDQTKLSYTTHLEPLRHKRVPACSPTQANR